jgi:hypothetical protein
VLARTAAVVVVIHDALPDARLLLRDARADGGHDAAGLVPRDDARLTSDTARHDPRRLCRRAVIVQIAAAHAGRLDLEHHVARPRCGIGKVPELELAIAEKHDALHAGLRYGCVRLRRVIARRTRRHNRSTRRPAELDP